MRTSTIDVGELLYETRIRFTRIAEYGTRLSDLSVEGYRPPPEGARFDFHFEGNVEGPRIRGAISGVDYARVRADGRFDLHIHAEIRTPDGESVSFHADGVATPEPGGATMQLRENVQLFSSCPGFQWLNTLQGWGTGIVDLQEGEVKIRVFAA